MRAARAPRADDDALVDWHELEDLELVIRARMKEHAAGAHASVFPGEGFDFVGLRDWQPGDRPSAIDWAQSTITNFSPLVSREFEQESTATVMLVADTSRSTRCGTGQISIAHVIARSVATLALAAAFFQDRVGLITVDGPHRALPVVPRIGKVHAIHCLEAYQSAVRSTGHPDGPTRGGLAGLLRRQSFVAVISDFLGDDLRQGLDELRQLAATHDVVLVMVDAAFAYTLPTLSAGWTHIDDAETGATRLLSAAELARMAERVRAIQDDVAARARRAGLELVRVGPEGAHTTLADFMAARRLRRR